MSVPALSVERVEKSYSTVRAVAGVSFEVRQGEVFGFLGPNGAGKTTTLRMIMGITRPDAGRVAFDGQPASVPRRVGYLPEERGLYEDAALLDVLVYFAALRGVPAGQAREGAQRWLDRLGLGDRAKAKVNTLSKGNQQKVQFASAVLHQPALAVLDEPFSGLDPLNQELFIELIGELRRGGTAVLLSAHQLGLVERLCDRFYLISRGRGLIEGTLDELRRGTSNERAEVLRLDVRARDGATSLDQVRDAILAQAPSRSPAIEPGENGAVRAVLDWPEGEDLGPLLHALAGRFRVDRVEMRPHSLHEIYVEAVGRDHGHATAADLAAAPMGARHV